MFILLKFHFKRLVRAFKSLADRPLLWLLPFYMVGINCGWDYDVNKPLYFLSAAAVCSFLFLIFSFSNLKYIQLLKILSPTFLIPSVFLLGFGLTSLAASLPDDPRHIINHVSEDRHAEHIILGGVVVESVKRPDSRYQRLIIDSREIIRAGIDGPDEILAVYGRARINVNGELFVEPGDYVRMPIVLRRISGFRNPRGLDTEKYWASQKIWVGGYVKSPRLVSSWPQYASPGFMAPLRKKATDFINERSPAPASGLLAAQLVGRRNAVDTASEEVFRSLGLSHILAVSGLHLGLWYGLCLVISLAILQKILPSALKLIPAFQQKGHRSFLNSQTGAYRGRVMAFAALLALIPALFYAALVGAASPVIRAAVMVSAVTLAALVRRGADSWNILAGAAWVLLLAEPYRLFTASFQMSFVATCAMVAVFKTRPGAGEKLGEDKSIPLWLRPISFQSFKTLVYRSKGKEAPRDNWPRRRKPFFRNAMLAALAGTFGTAPLVLWHFSRLSLAGIAANFFLTPVLSAFVLIPGLLSMMALPISETLAGWILDFSSTILIGLMPLMEKAADLAGPGVLLPIPGLLFIPAYFTAGWIWLRSPLVWPRRLALCLGILLIGLLPYWLTGPGNQGVLKVTVLDVGQGSAVHVNFPDGRQMMIDGGGSLYFDPGERVITPYLLRHGISGLDIVALTHPDEDHLKGLVSLSRNFKPKEIWENPWPPLISPLYKEFLQETAHIERADLNDLWRGWTIGPVEVEMLWPRPDYQCPSLSAPKGNWANNMGMVLKIKWGEKSFLITGDIEQKTERALVQMYGTDLSSTVLLAPHHGSATSMTKEFLETVNPDYVIFSVGHNNYFGLPHERSITRAEEAGAAIWRTDYQGAAIFEVREKEGDIVLKLLPPQ